MLTLDFDPWILILEVDLGYCAWSSLKTTPGCNCWPFDRFMMMEVEGNESKLQIFRAQIISKKISTRFFENQKYHELKLKFYGYMIEVMIEA